MFLLCSCIDPFPLDGDTPEPQPVIEGLVVNVMGESFVKVSLELSILGVQDDPSPLVSAARVEVEDGRGNLITFCEKSTGFYQPEDEAFVGSRGEIYTLMVRLADGRSYRSRSEMMHPGVQVDSVFATFNQFVIPNTNQLTGAHNFFITASTDPSEEPVLFRTHSLGIAQVAANINPPPPLCAGPLCAEICYSFRRPINREIVLGNTKGTAANKITLQVASQDYDFHSRYFIEVKAFSLSLPGHRFWSSLASQQQIEGSIFDPQIAKIEGTNVYSVETDQEIIGYFGASEMSSSSLFFNRAESASFLTPIPTARNSCVEVWTAATLEVPKPFQ